LKPQHFIVLLLTISGWSVYYVYKPFMQDIAIAILLMFATLGISKHLDKYLKRRWQISTIMTLFLGVMFFAPLVYLINAIALMVAKIDPVVIQQNVEGLANYLQTVSLPTKLLKQMNIEPEKIYSALSDIFSEDNINNYLKYAISYFGSLAAHSAVFFKDMFLILIFYFFAYLYGEDIGHFIKRILPLDTAQTQLLFNELSNSMGVVFFSILTTAIFEGALFAIIAGVFGLNMILMGILYGFASLVPIVGGALMWVPVSIYLWFTKDSTSALIVAIYSIIVISIIADTFIKPVIIKEIDYKLLKETQAVNEILVFFSIIAGLTTIGFWGMIIGPAVTTIFIAFLKLYDQIQSNFKEQQ